MYEFDVVSVSTYEAASLAAKLTEKSADGWEVVAIVPAGSDITAYLKKTASDAAAATSDAPAAAATAATVGDTAPAAEAAPVTPAPPPRGAHRPGRPPTRRAGGAPAPLRLLLPAPHRRPRPSRPPRRSPPGGTTIPPVASSCGTGTVRRGPSTSRAPAS